MKKQIKNMFALTDHYKGKVKRLTIHIQDNDVFKSPDEKDTLVGRSATISGTLQLFTGSKDTVKNVNFVLPLSNNKEFKAHILAMIDEAMKLSEKKSK